MEIILEGKKFHFPKKVSTLEVEDFEKEAGVKFGALDLNNISHANKLFFVCIRNEHESMGIEFNYTYRQFARLLTTESLKSALEVITQSMQPTVKSEIEELGNVEAVTLEK